MNYSTPNTSKKVKAPPIASDIYEMELHIIKEDTRKPSQFGPGGDPVIHVGFVIVEDTELYGTSVWKNNITPKISPPYDGGKATNLWELLSSILDRKLSKDECNALADEDGAKVNKILMHGRIRGFVDLKEYIDHDGEKAYSNPVTKFFPAKAQLEPFNKEKGDARYAARIGKAVAPIATDEPFLPVSPDVDAFLFGNNV